MTGWLQRRSSQEWTLFAVVIVLAIGFPAARWFIVPACDRWAAARTAFDQRRQELHELKGYLQIQHAVDQRYLALPAAAFQIDAQAITLSTFLRRIEGLARSSRLALVHAKPGPIEQDARACRYPVELTVSGTLSDVAGFVTGLLAADEAVRLDRFSLRGTRGGQAVECRLTLGLLKLKPVATGRSSHGDLLHGVRDHG
jgi:Tfp pilus assembly protein PilO